VVPVNTPDFNGLSGKRLCAGGEGYTRNPAAGKSSNTGKRKKQVNVLAGSFLTPGDIEHIMN